MFGNAHFIHIFDNWFADAPRRTSKSFICIITHKKDRMFGEVLTFFFFMGKLKKRKLERSQNKQEALQIYLDTFIHFLYENRRLFFL